MMYMYNSTPPVPTLQQATSACLRSKLVGSNESTRKIGLGYQESSLIGGADWSRTTALLSLHVFTYPTILPPFLVLEILRIRLKIEELLGIL